MNPEKAKIIKSKDLFIFDMGNVVIKNIDFLSETAKVLNIDEKSFIEDYLIFDFPLMEASITFNEYWSHVEERFNVKVENNPFDFTLHSTLNPLAIKLINELRNYNKRIVLGSNTFAPHFNYFKNKGWDKYFNYCYVSHEMKIAKPKEDFFNYILSHEQVLPSKAFFIDDMKENILSAEKLGIKSFQYTSDEEFNKFFNLESI